MMIALGIIGYFVIGIIAAICFRLADDYFDETGFMATVAFWPIIVGLVIMLAPFTIIPQAIYNKIDKYLEKKREQKLEIERIMNEEL